jgi:hypothetical protein
MQREPLRKIAVAGCWTTLGGAVVATGGALAGAFDVEHSLVTFEAGCGVTLLGLLMYFVPTFVAHRRGLI